MAEMRLHFVLWLLLLSPLGARKHTRRNWAHGAGHAADQDDQTSVCTSFLQVRCDRRKQTSYQDIAKRALMFEGALVAFFQESPRPRSVLFNELRRVSMLEHQPAGFPPSYWAWSSTYGHEAIAAKCPNPYGTVAAPCCLVYLKVDEDTDQLDPQAYLLLNDADRNRASVRKEIGGFMYTIGAANVALGGVTSSQLTQLLKSSASNV